VIRKFLYKKHAAIIREAKRQEKAEQSRLKQEEKERLREARNQQKADRN
jgi:membrane protein involved in colicin uptake